MKQTQHILVVDDEPGVLQLFTRLLKKGGYSVSGVDSGIAALKAIKSRHVDLVVLDLNMPGTDGLEILKALRAMMPGLRILVVSGFMEGALLEASEMLGATASLTKIEAPKRLLKTVETLLQ